MFIRLRKRPSGKEEGENAEIGVPRWSPDGRVAERTSSRLRRTNDRSVLRVHEDHEDDENAEIEVPLHAQVKSLRIVPCHNASQHGLSRFLDYKYLSAVQNHLF